MSSYIPSSRRFGSTMISRTSSGVARKRMLDSMALTLTDLPVPVDPAISRCGIVARSRDERLAVDGLAERQRQLRLRAPIGVRLEQLAHRDLLAIGVRNLDADRRLAGDAIDQHRLGLHREAEIVGEAGDLAVLHAGVRLELVGRDDRARVNLDDRSFDRELAALLLEQPRPFHQLALVDLALGLRRVEQRHRRERVRALLALGRHLLRLGQRQRRRRRHRQLLDRRRGSGLGRRRLERRGGRADHRGGARGFRRRLLGDRLAAGRPRLRIGGARGHGDERRVVDRPGRRGAFLRLLFLEMLLQHLPALLLALLFVAAGADGAEQRRPLIDDHRADRGEQPAERELRREDERQEEQRQDQDDRAGAIQVLGEHARQRRAHVAAGAELPCRRSSSAPNDSDRNAAVQPKSSAAPKALV